MGPTRHFAPLFPPFNFPVLLVMQSLPLRRPLLDLFFFLFKCVILNVMPLVWSRTIESGSVT